MIRQIIHYAGHVQGVGFRWTVNNLAKDFRVAGYVQNLADGRVRLDVQGERKQVAGLLQAVDHAMAGNISSKDVQDAEFDPDLGQPGSPKAFQIQR